MQVTTETIGGMLEKLVSLKGGQSAQTLVGLVGRGIQASRTPGMHEREAARLGFDCRYVLIDFDQLGLPDSVVGEVLAAAGAAGFAGLNVTHPFKQAVLPHVHALSPEAEAVGAVNTVVFAAGRRTGHNTDSWGFAESFRDAMPGVKLGHVVQFGAGGAGAAVAYALMELGVGGLSIVDVDPRRSKALAESLSSRFVGRVRAGTNALATTADGVVNCTPIGMDKYPGVPFPIELLSPSQWVAEIIYFPQDTELLRRARALGCRTLPGAGMAIYQAVRAFELFTGRVPDRRAMAQHFAAA